MPSKTPTKNSTNRCVRRKAKKTARYATYISSNLDGGGPADQNSVQVQRQAIQEYCRNYFRDGSIKHYEDVAQPGRALRRPALKQLMADAASGKLDAVCIYTWDCVTRSPPDYWGLSYHFYRHRVGVGRAGPMPHRLEEVWHTYQSQLNLTRHRRIVQFQAEKKPTTVQCAIYLRGRCDYKDRRNPDIQRETIRMFLERWWLGEAIRLPTVYEDVDSAKGENSQPALRRLLDDLDTGRIHCVIAQSFDRFTQCAVKAEALIAKCRHREVALMTLCPTMFHVWGKRMEDAWLAAFKDYKPRKTKAHAK